MFLSLVFYFFLRYNYLNLLVQVPLISKAHKYDHSMTVLLERNSSNPLYAQISENLRERITHDLSPGDQLPSENQLMREYQVSRNTIRLAIDRLIKHGLVYSVKGKGTFVNGERLQYGLFQLVSFTEEMNRRGLRPSSRILNVEKICPPEPIRSKLELGPDQEVFFIARLRLANGKPMALNLSYHPCHLCPTLDQEDLQHGSIYQTIEDQYGLLIGYANQTIRPEIADKVHSDLMKVPCGSPMLLVEGVAYLCDNTPIEYSQLYYRGDRYEFPIRAIRRPFAENGGEQI
jgi:GntR family transcriptional regulator